MKRIVQKTLAAAAGSGLLAAAGVAVAAPHSAASGGAVIPVAPGESIQAAVDAAAPGDTIQLQAGVYAEAVYAGDKPLTVRGAGEHRTIVVPPEVVTPTDCWDGAEDASAFCWQAPTGPVTVSDLTTQGHAGNGVIGIGMRGVTVKRHTGIEHGEYGLAFFGSTGITLSDNTEIGAGGEAGFYVGVTADADAVLKNNTASGWLFGAFLRDSRGGLLQDNTFTRNCVGVTLLDTPPEPEGGPTPGEEPTATGEPSPTEEPTATGEPSPTEEPTATGEPSPTEEPTATGEPSPTEEPTATPTQTPPAGEEPGPFVNAVVGDWDVLGNRVTDNDRACPAAGPAPALSGHGIAILGGTEILVSRNTISDHDSTGLSAFPKAGVTIVSPAQFGVVPPRDIAVVLNTFARNDLDVAWDELGEGVVVGQTSCTTSMPASLCGAAPAPAV